MSVRDTERMVKVYQQGDTANIPQKKINNTPDFIKSTKDELIDHLSSKLLFKQQQMEKEK